MASLIVAFLYSVVIDSAEEGNFSEKTSEETSEEFEDPKEKKFGLVGGLLKGVIGRRRRAQEKSKVVFICYNICVVN